MISHFDARDYLGSDELRTLVVRFVRRRVPEAEVDDVVQTILVAALEASSLPAAREELRKWVVGIARHKIADLHRGRRGHAVELPENLAVEVEPVSARSLARWAEKQTEGNPDAARTLGWMAREGGGEKLAHIAAEEDLPAPQVRQRVSRLRRFMRDRWKAELAAVAAVVVAMLVLWAWLRDPAPQPVAPAPEIVPVPAPEAPSPVERGQERRRLALEDCAAERWEACLDGLDDAAELDPEGDEAAAVRAARGRAERALAPDDSEGEAEDSKVEDGEDESRSAPSSTPTSTVPSPTSAVPLPPTDLKKSSPPPKAPPPKAQPSKPSGMSSDFFPGSQKK